MSSTGWSRDTWVGLADRMLSAVRPYASGEHALIGLPGSEGGYGRAVDGLEGFARTFLLAGFRIAGESGAGLDELAEWYSRGIAAGVDPDSPERWVRLDEHAQAKVEAASLALVLDMTRPWIWDRLSPRTQQQVVDYFAPAVGDQTYPRINWVWFRLVVQTFLRSVGGPWSSDDMAEDLATHDGFVRADGWLADGDERSYDHYVGWALHTYPTLWSRMQGAEDLAEPRRERDTGLLDRYLEDAVALVGADGSPLIQGRSLIYRFAGAAPFWVGAIAGVPSTSLGTLRRAASRVVGHFVARGAPDARGLLTSGWHGAWPGLAQSYSGPGSPYWAAKGMLGLALPADHPVWAADEEPLPVERRDLLRTVRAPGWIVSGTSDDGVVRVVNHGTDHAREGEQVGDSPLYARIGYSTATSPLLDEASWTGPLDQSAVLVDVSGRATHRAGLRALGVRVDDGVGVGASLVDAHWLEPATVQQHHGSGYEGTTTRAGRLRVVSLVRGAWEVRLVRVEAVADSERAATWMLRIAGWPVVGSVDETVHDDVVELRGGDACSRIVALTGTLGSGSTARPGASPLGDPAVVPWLTYAVREGEWSAALIELARGARDHTPPVLGLGRRDDVAEVVWPDGRRTVTDLGLEVSGGSTPASR